jgi:transcriptional regulator with XRE-family HTH domain
MDKYRVPGFAARLRELREGAGLTQAQLAERAGVHKLTVAKLEQGIREPSWATVLVLSDALGLECTAFKTAPTGANPTGRRPRGRPRKAAVEPAPKRPRGRPKKAE